MARVEPLPADLLEHFEVDPRTVAVLDGRVPNWRVIVDGQPAVLKREWHGDESDVVWEHAFLSRLATTGFPSPRPLGRGWMVHRGELWTIRSFRPGRTLGWSPQPALIEVGAFIARYHDAVAHFDRPAQRPLVPVLDELQAVVPWARLEQTLAGSSGVQLFRAHLDETADTLAVLGHADALRLPIHGDFTTDNVLVDGDPPAIVGAIDFALTSWEPPLADLAFALFRSGRRDPLDLSLDANRVAALVAGYAACRPLPTLAAAALPAYLKARGLQLIIRWTRAHVTDCSVTLARVDAIARQQFELSTALQNALRVS
jgi:Ser/Thr protein kinase RdoA (MazF antagonist)